MITHGRRTSFFSVTDDPELGIERIEIPHFQRDYAQGRESEAVTRIRTDFLEILHNAVTGGDAAEVGLDFVYGGVDEGTLRPLDGQQRLTTLFLLHWYIASRSGHLADDHGWKRFSYATRQSARMFCERLVAAPLPKGTKAPSAWIKDQSWYLFVWRHDPTIQSMLVMIDAIHQRFRKVDVGAAWARLTDIDAPAIWFLLLPLSELGSSGEEDMKPEDLYIKMNSRGKPLTEFENFKAHFEKTIHSSPRAEDFAREVDTTWSDLLWHHRGDDALIDDEFMRYFEFITEICEWRDGRDDGAGERLGRRTVPVFGEENPQHEAHLEFLFQALDVWVQHSSQEAFESLFTTGGDGDSAKVRLFFRQSDSDLFEACCRSYGETSGNARVFSLGQTLVLYAVLIHFIEDTNEFPRRIRHLRNLIEASSDELRLEKMPEILQDVHRIIRHGAIDAVAVLNKAQVTDEERKADFLEANPSLRGPLFALEDQELLRGSLGAFELDAATFEARASNFTELMSQRDLWTDLLGALLAVGEYQRQPTNARQFLFGTDSGNHRNAWRQLLTGATPERLEPTRLVLAEFLDRVAETSMDLHRALRAITKDYLAQCNIQQLFDWRYYMVKYPVMREEGSSTYYAERTDDSDHDSMGYSLCMLRAGRKILSSYHRDPYLLAISRELEDASVVEDMWFIGPETQARRLPLTVSGASLRCVPTGFELSSPPEDSFAEAFSAVCAEMGVADNLVLVPQADVSGRLIDTADRIQTGVDIIRRLVAAGL